VLWTVTNELLLQPREYTAFNITLPYALAAAPGAVLWTVANELLLQPREYTAFNLALDRLRDDPRVLVALGSPVSGYGQETRNRAARQRIPHRVYTDDRGVEHVQARAARLRRPRPPPTRRGTAERVGARLGARGCALGRARPYLHMNLTLTLQAHTTAQAPDSFYLADPAPLP